jgi:hypothetical protein
MMLTRPKVHVAKANVAKASAVATTRAATPMTLKRVKMPKCGEAV